MRESGVGQRLYRVQVCVGRLRLCVCRPLLFQQAYPFLLQALARGDIFGEDDDPADLARSGEPGTHFPLDPLDRAVRAVEAILIALLDGPGQAPAVDRLPELWDLGEGALVPAPPNLPLGLLCRPPAPRVRQCSASARGRG